VVVVLLVVAAVVVAQSSGPGGHPLAVASARDIGRLIQPQEWLRDGAESAEVGGRVMWIFSDTLFPTASVEGSHLHPNSSATSSLVAPARLHTPVDGNGVPAQLVPFDELGAAYNSLSGRSDDRIAVWPTGIVPQPDGSAVVVFSDVKVGPGNLNYSFLHMGLATVAAGATTAVRDPTPLFAKPEPTFWSGPVERDGLVDMYGCDRIEGERFGCRVAQVPADEMHDRSAWRFWDGAAWTPDVGGAEFVLDGPNGGLSVSWNDHLQRYLAVYLQGFTNTVFLRTAQQPQGPWSAPVVAFRGRPAPAGMVNYGAFEHPELAVDGGRVLTVTYFHPLGAFRGEIRVVRLRLA
jgi:hypothetical protein